MNNMVEKVTSVIMVIGSGVQLVCFVVISIILGAQADFVIVMVPFDSE